MRDFSIDLIWAKIQVAITAVGGWIGWFLGGVDGMLIALIVLMALDYLSSRIRSCPALLASKASAKRC